MVPNVQRHGLKFDNRIKNYIINNLSKERALYTFIYNLFPSGLVIQASRLSGIPLPLEDDIIATLRTNYRKVADKFAYSLIEETDEIKQIVDRIDIEDLPSIGDKPITDDGTSRQTTTQEREMIINSLLAQQIRVISVARADQILATTQKNLQRDVDNVVAEAAATGVFLTAAQIAEQSRMRFNQNGINRSNLIAMTEVEMMAENSKNTEQEVLMATGATIAGALLINALEKIWMAVLDSVTRAAHAVADGQRVPLNESFMVGGEQLRYPGDPRGRPENIISCRCSSQTIKK